MLHLWKTRFKPSTLRPSLTFSSVLQLYLLLNINTSFFSSLAPLLSSLLSIVNLSLKTIISTISLYLQYLQHPSIAHIFWICTQVARENTQLYRLELSWRHGFQLCPDYLPVLLSLKSPLSIHHDSCFKPSELFSSRGTTSPFSHQMVLPFWLQKKQKPWLIRKFLSFLPLQLYPTSTQLMWLVSICAVNLSTFAFLGTPTYQLFHFPPTLLYFFFIQFLSLIDWLIDDR